MTTNNEGAPKQLEIIVGHVYRAKCRRRLPPRWLGDFRRYDDRHVLYVSPHGSVQYDSPKLGGGHRRPTISGETFAAWAGADVTAEYPGGDWAGWDMGKSATEEAAP